MYKLVGNDKVVGGGGGGGGGGTGLTVHVSVGLSVYPAFVQKISSEPLNLL